MESHDICNLLSYGWTKPRKTKCVYICVIHKCKSVNKTVNLTYGYSFYHSCGFSVDLKIFKVKSWGRRKNNLQTTVLPCRPHFLNLIRLICYSIKLDDTLTIPLIMDSETFNHLRIQKEVYFFSRCLMDLWMLKSPGQEVSAFFQQW